MNTPFLAVSGRNYPKEVIPLIDGAKNCIDIVVFDWRWYSQDPGSACQLFNQAIIRAAKRGVKIRAIANNDEVVNILRKAGIDAKKLLTTRLVHCKLLIIDEKIAVTGSHNFTQSAFQANLELSVILGEEMPKEEIIAFYNHIWSIS